MLPEWREWFFGILLDSSLRISLIACVIALILLIVRVRAGSVRHAAWTAVLCAMLLMPVLPYCLPTIAVPTLFPVAGGSLNAAAGETRVDPLPLESAAAIRGGRSLRAALCRGERRSTLHCLLLRLVRRPVRHGRLPDSSCTAPAC